MSDLIRRKDAIDEIREVYEREFPTASGAFDEFVISIIPNILKNLPSEEPETITIEELSNQLGCATIQSALYWFEFLKTLDLLGFAIIRKETK